MSAMIVPLVPDEGWVVLHLFCKATPHSDGEAVSRAVKAAEESGQQVVSFAVLGHKADLGFMLIGPDLVAARRSQSALVQAGLELASSYLSLTEVSEYAERHARRASRSTPSPQAAAGWQKGDLLLPHVQTARRH